jgi:hypothetical protein
VNLGAFLNILAHRKDDIESLLECQEKGLEGHNPFAGGCAEIQGGGKGCVYLGKGFVAHPSQLRD